MKKYPARTYPPKKKIRRFLLIQVIATAFFVLIIMSCASYKTIVPGSTDHLSRVSPSIAPGNVINGGRTFNSYDPAYSSLAAINMHVKFNKKEKPK